MKTRFETARILFEKIKKAHVEAEILRMLHEYSNPDRLEFEVLYDNGERSWLLKPDKRLHCGQVIVGIIVADVAISMREGLVTCNWYQARDYCRLDTCIGDSMSLLPDDLHLEKVIEGLNLQLDKCEGDFLSFGWYWTDHKINDTQALAVQIHTGKVKAFNLSANLRYRPCYRLLPKAQKEDDHLNALRK